MHCSIICEYNQIYQKYQLQHDAPCLLTRNKSPSRIPSLANRTEWICQTALRGLDVMLSTVDSFKDFATYAVIHGILLKGLKMALKLMLAHEIVFAALIAYKVFKLIDAIFIQNREKKFFQADPNFHCRYTKESIGKAFSRWVKSSEQIGTPTDSQHD